jgi:hypothetical protein
MKNQNIKHSVQIVNIETLETITVVDTVEDFDTWMETNTWGIVQFEADIDGEYGYCALVAPMAGPNYEMDMATGEMEPVKTTNWNDIMPGGVGNQREAQKAAIIEAIDEIEAAKATKKSKAKNTQSNTQKGGKMPKSTKSPKTITSTKNHESFAAFVQAQGPVTREDVFNDDGLRQMFLTPDVIAKIDAGDRLETKRWNSRINRFIRKTKRDGVDIQCEGQGKTAVYFIPSESHEYGEQLSLPFDVEGDDTEMVIERPVVDPKRAEEAENQMLSFESLLATLDEEEATITSDDQVALDEAQKMLK